MQRASFRPARSSLRHGRHEAEPWKLQTPPGTSSYEAYRDLDTDPPALVVQVGKTQLRYHARCIDDLSRDARRARRLDLARQHRRAEAAADGTSRRGRAARPIR